jgi:hypothetical protein
MTEAEWLACTYTSGILSPFGKRVSSRKLRLFGCACGRRLSHIVTDERFEEALSVLERYADGLAKESDRIRVSKCDEFKVVKGGKRTAGHFARSTIHDTAQKTIQRAINYLGVAVASALQTSPKSHSAEYAQNMILLRDIFGNPFRPVTFSPSWRTDTVLSLARQMYESREFGAMPILADALQDAGCDSDDILAHCRGAGPHVRGCWVVDLVLGKE